MNVIIFYELNCSYNYITKDTVQNATYLVGSSAVQVLTPFNFTFPSNLCNPSKPSLYTYYCYADSNLLKKCNTNIYTIDSKSGTVSIYTSSSSVSGYSDLTIVARLTAKGLMILGSLSIGTI